MKKSLFRVLEEDRIHIEKEILEAQKRKSKEDEAYWTGAKTTMIRFYHFMGFKYQMEE